jgi:copper chaperone NosL
MRLSPRSRWLLAAAAFLMATLYVLPIWKVALSAPQYPEGLGMFIRLSTITGFEPNDLENINNLNHYIGMQRIVPESIPELQFLPYVVAGLIALALVAALTGRRSLAVTWVVLFALLAIGGLADFYRWSYDYGHNLDVENAIIKIPGMSYQPPLLGTKKLLNFTATSLPALGGIAAAVSLALGVVALWSDRTRGRGTVAPAAIGETHTAVV